ncbi:hypothetical protein [Enterococcus asini]|uniref:hypothetical protein n=1 Tax=Enterococcus asini TaxID=57732 RepID=UPI0026DCB527|nr:hypothetical protein [Enterococcus asini]
MKKPLLQRKWVWVVGILLIAIGVFEIKAQFSKASEEKARIEATENADKVLKGKVEVPDPYFKSKEEVEKLFDQAGLKADFVVTNFDDKAKRNERDIKVGDCDQLNSEQPNIKYYDTDEVGDKYGFYADKGATIIVGYTDHDFSGGGKNNSSSDSTTQSSDIFAGKVEIPETQFKSKEQVEKEFEAVGLKATFVVQNLDDMATQNKVKIKAGDCGVIADQAGMGFLDDGEKYGIYADEGATLTIGYSDHDFDGTQPETAVTSSSEAEAIDTVESSETDSVEMNSNEAIQDYLGEKLNVLEVNGVYIEPGNYTTQITLEGSTSMKSVINQVAQAVRYLNKVDLSQFSNVGISVKTKMTDGELGFAVKSDWDPTFINSEKALTTQNKNVESFASSWWQLQE